MKLITIWTVANVFAAFLVLLGSTCVFIPMKIQQKGITYYQKHPRIALYNLALDFLKSKAYILSLQVFGLLLLMVSLFLLFVVHQNAYYVFNASQVFAFSIVSIILFIYHNRIDRYYLRKDQDLDNVHFGIAFLIMVSARWLRGRFWVLFSTLALIEVIMMLYNSFTR